MYQLTFNPKETSPKKKLHSSLPLDNSGGTAKMAGGGVLLTKPGHLSSIPTAVERQNQFLWIVLSLHMCTMACMRIHIQINKYNSEKTKLVSTGEMVRQVRVLWPGTKLVRTGEMVRQVKRALWPGPTTRFYPQNSQGGGREPTLTSSSLASTHPLWHMCTHMNEWIETVIAEAMGKRENSGRPAPKDKVSPICLCLYPLAMISDARP